MGDAAKRIIAMLDGERIEDTTIDKEMATLAQHLGNFTTFA